MSVSTYVYALMTDARQGALDRLFQAVLWVFSKIYGAAALVRRQLYRQHIIPSYRSPKPVISVGNITLGGVGKTPLVIAIVEALQQQQLKVAVLTRGYMPKGEVFSDEALMLKERLPNVPIITGADRRRGIEDCLKHHAVDVFVCDDAFGHLQLQRDLNILVINANNPFGNGQVVPRGILREPLSTLAAADMIVLTKTDMPSVNVTVVTSRIQSLVPKAAILTSQHRPVACVDIFDKNVISLDHFKGISVLAFSGLGDTGAFHHSLEAAGLKVVHMSHFMDHHVYTEDEMTVLRKLALQHEVQMVITTHKDAVKVAAFKDMWQGFRVYYLKVDLEISNGKNVFDGRIMSVVRR